MKNKLLILAALIIFSGTSAYSAADPKAMVKGIRPMSMGGAFTAVADDENAFFYNPAGITQRTGKLIRFFSLDLGINTDTYDFAKFYNDNRDELENFDGLTADQQVKLINRINKDILGTTANALVSLPDFAFISGPFKTSSNHFNIGAGLFSYVNADIQFNRSIIVPTLSYRGEATAMAAVPVAYRIVSLEDIRLPGQLSLGANFKYIYRAKGEAGDLSVDELEDFDFPWQHGGGFGMDFGAIYHLNPRWNFGLQLTDAFYTNIDYSEYEDDKHPSRSKESYTAGIRPELNIGAAYFPEKIYYWPGKFIKTKNTVTVAADLSDVANEDESLTDSFWKKVHFGAEVKLNPFSLRAGFNSGYPTVGAGVSLSGLLNLEYAFFGEELGRYAGQEVSWYHRLVFSVKIGSRNGRAYRYTLKDVKNKQKKTKEKPAPAEEVNEIFIQQEKPEIIEGDITPLKVTQEEKEDISRPAEIREIEIK